MENQDSIIAILVYGIIFITFLLVGLLLFFSYSRKVIIQKEIEKVNLELDAQKKVLQVTISTQEEERKRIAQDLHDAISSKLNVVSLTTNSLLEEDSLNAEQKTGLHHILKITTSTLNNSRRIAHALLPPVLDKFGLKVALEELFEELTKSTKLQILHDINALEELSKIEQLHIFRITQELLNNGINHGKATQLKVDLEKLNTGFKLTCQDNGKGFDIKNQELKRGLGLQNIESRAEILDCDLIIKSDKGIGSTFNIISKNL